jgi:hypothetical protein
MSAPFFFLDEESVISRKKSLPSSLTTIAYGKEEEHAPRPTVIGCFEKTNLQV